MSVRSLSRHTARTYRRTKTRGSVFREPDHSWAVQEPTFRCEVQVRRELRQDTGPGEVRAGEWNVYTQDATLDIVPGDVLETVSGDKHPLTLEIIEVDNQRGRHLEMVCTEWEGSLT